MPTSLWMRALMACGHEGPLRRRIWRRGVCRGPIRSPITGPEAARWRQTRRRQSAGGAAEYASRDAAIIPGYESCTARILTDGSAVLMVGIQSHGQGLETALSQIAAEELGIDPARIAVRHGDTEIS